MSATAFFYQQFSPPGRVHLPGGLAFFRRLLVGVRCSGFVVAFKAPPAPGVYSYKPAPPGSVVFWFSPREPFHLVFSMWAEAGLKVYWVNTALFPYNGETEQQNLWEL